MTGVRRAGVLAWDAGRMVVVKREPAVRTLEAVVESLAGEVSPVRLGQLRMVVRMWERALAVWPEDRRRPSVQARGMFGPAGLEVFWALAVAGELRGRGPGVGPLPVASQRVVRDCLGILAEAVVPGQVVALPVVSQQAPKAVVPPGQLVVLYRRLVAVAGDGPLARGETALSVEDRTRLLALVSVVLDTGARSGELAQQRIGDLSADMGGLRSVRRPQNGTRMEPAEKVWALQPGTVVALRRWLAVRERLVADLEGGREALWVSLVANQWQEQPGLPLRPQGIRKAYARGVAALNWVMAGEVGWEPLPGKLERLTRTVRAELGEVPRESPEPRRGGPRGRPARELSAEQVATVRRLLGEPVSVGRIAAEAGISLPVLYRRFPEVRDRPRARGRGGG